MLRGLDYLQTDLSVTPSRTPSRTLFCICFQPELQKNICNFNLKLLYAAVLFVAHHFTRKPRNCMSPGNDWEIDQQLDNLSVLFTTHIERKICNSWNYKDHRIIGMFSLKLYPLSNTCFGNTYPCFHMESFHL